MLASLPYYELHPLGLEQRRADTLSRAARAAEWLEAAWRLPPDAALARLRTIPGVGAWTAAETARAAFGDPDAVSVGDFHLPNLVGLGPGRRAAGDDARMLELLEPYRGQRARLVRLLELSGSGAALRSAVRGRAPSSGSDGAPRTSRRAARALAASVTRGVDKVVSSH